MKFTHTLIFCICLGSIVGCEPRDIPHAQAPNAEPAWQKGSPEAMEALANAGVEPAPPAKPKRVAVPLEHAKITPSRRIEISTGSGQGFMSSAPVPGRLPGMNEMQAMQAIKQTIERSLEVGPTLVVWVVDQSASATRLASAALSTAKGFYGQEPFQSAAAEAKLLTAMIGFAESTVPLIDPPAHDITAVNAGFDAFKSTSEGRELLFTAVDESLTKYLSFRAQEGREMLVIVISDEPGDDLHKLESAVKNAKKLAIPIYVIGETVPLGKPAAKSAGFGDTAKPDPQRTLAIDALRSDLAPIKFWSSSYGNSESFDSGFGPWALERLCRESEGRFFGVSSGTHGNGYMRPDPAILNKYAPDYVSIAAYDQLLAENKCRDRLIKVAQMEPAEAMIGAKVSFAKGNNEARFTQALTQAQRDPARLEPAVNRIYDALAEAEGDRAKLTGLRWQAAYDTAYGRICAAKARIDGYNAMIALLKRGKTFTNPESKGWVLQPADKIDTGSAIQKLADKAKLYLERVQTEHAGTPWARMAADELQTPLGWTWVEQ